MDSVRVWKRNCNFWNDPLGGNDSHSAKRCPPSKAVCSPLVCPLTEVESIRRPRPVVGRGRSSDWIGQQHLKNPREKEGKRERERERATRKEGREEGGRAPGSEKEGWKRPKRYRGTIGKSLYLGDPLRSRGPNLPWILGFVNRQCLSCGE